MVSPSSPTLSARSVPRYPDSPGPIPTARRMDIASDHGWQLEVDEPVTRQAVAGPTSVLQIVVSRPSNLSRSTCVGVRTQPKGLLPTADLLQGRMNGMQPPEGRSARQAGEPAPAGLSASASMNGAASGVFEPAQDAVRSHFSLNVYSCWASRNTSVRLSVAPPTTNSTPSKPGIVVRNETEPSGLRRDATSLLNSPKSNTVLSPFVTRISPSEAFAYREASFTTSAGSGGTVSSLRSAAMRSRRAGASIKLTVDTYGRWLPMGNKAAVDRLDQGFATRDYPAPLLMHATLKT